jgi:hypothetical protein
MTTTWAVSMERRLANSLGEIREIKSVSQPMEGPTTIFEKRFPKPPFETEQPIKADHGENKWRYGVNSMLISMIMSAEDLLELDKAAFLSS